jgi:hypothetical protein
MCHIKKRLSMLMQPVVWPVPPAQGKQILNLVLGKPITNVLTWDATYDFVVVDVFGYDSARPNDRAVADNQTRADEHIGPNPHVTPYRHGRVLLKVLNGEGWPSAKCRGVEGGMRRNEGARRVAPHPDNHVGPNRAKAPERCSRNPRSKGAVTVSSERRSRNHGIWTYGHMILERAFSVYGDAPSKSDMREA